MRARGMTTGIGCGSLAGSTTFDTALYMLGGIIVENIATFPATLSSRTSHASHDIPAKRIVGPNA